MIKATTGNNGEIGNNQGAASDAREGMELPGVRRRSFLRGVGRIGSAGMPAGWVPELRVNPGNSQPGMAPSN